MTNLNEYTSRLVVPAIPGVEHQAVPIASEDEGFAITLVPKSDGLPHMAMAQGQQRYYFRTGDSFLPMEHFMLADRFGRRPQPKLELTTHWERIGNKTFLVLGIMNIGKGIARFPALHIEERRSEGLEVYPLTEGFEWPGGVRTYGLSERSRAAARNGTGWRMFCGDDRDAIHPGTTMDVATALGWVMPTDPTAKVDWKDISFRYSLYCDGFSLTEATETIHADEVKRAALGR